MQTLKPFITRASLSVALLAAGISKLQAEPAETMYVDGNVATSGNGKSWATAFKTIQHANVASSHNTHRLVLIRGDQIYYATDTLYLDRGGLSATERKTWRGVPGTNGMGRLPILSGASNLDETTFTAVGEPYTNVYQVALAGSVGSVWEGPSDGLWGTDWTLYASKTNLDDVQNTPGSRWLTSGTLYVHTSTGTHPTNFIVKYVVPGRRVNVSMSYVSFENLEFRHMWDTTLQAVGSPHQTHISIYSNVFYSGSIGVRVMNCSEVDLADNVFFNFSSAAVVVSSNYNYAASHDVRIRGNTVHGPAGFSVNVDGNNWIYGNVLDGTGIFLGVYDSSDPSLFSRIYNNLSYRPPSSGIYILRAPGTRIYNNTVAESPARGILLNNESTNAWLFNNIVTVGGAGSQGIYVNNTAQAGLVSSNNNLYATDGGNVGYWGGNKTTLADWQAASGQDGNSLSVDPKFADAAAGDFRLGRSSPCRDVGTAALGGVSAPDTDLDGIRRPVNDRYDLGAYEYPFSGSLLLVR